MNKKDGDEVQEEVIEERKAEHREFNLRKDRDAKKGALYETSVIRTSFCRDDTTFDTAAVDTGLVLWFHKRHYKTMGHVVRFRLANTSNGGKHKPLY